MRQILLLLLLAVVLSLVVYGDDNESMAQSPILPQQTTLYFPMIYKADQQVSLKRGVHIALGYTASDIDKLGGAWFLNNGTMTTYQDSEFVPMIRNISKMDLLLEAVQNSDGWLAGFNEPDTESRYISPNEAALFWRQIEQIATANNIKLVSPATSPGQISWLWQMATEYYKIFGRLPRFDAVAIHAYYNSPDEAITYITTVRSGMSIMGYGDSELWITEMGSKCPDTTPEQTVYVMIEMAGWIEQTDLVQRYAWFTNRVPDDSAWIAYKPCALVDDVTGNLLPLGEVYAGQ